VSGVVAPYILNLGSRWRLLVNFTLWPLYWTGGWVSPTDGQEAVMMRKISVPVGNQIMIIQPTT